MKKKYVGVYFLINPSVLGPHISFQRVISKANLVAKDDKSVVMSCHGGEDLHRRD